MTSFNLSKYVLSMLPRSLLIDSHNIQEERRQLQARMDAISALLTKPGSKRKYSNSEVKTEDSNEPGPSTRPMTKAKKVKSEASDKPTIRPGEIIDLTLD
ncbi:hypothetical protein ONZ45_g15820 [Pleurotus djamor]|nr:hypothetical protein ONZ45_g15820 [Pleurotus djamor]